ncbi:MAG: DNA-deoxyinosine glycosylase [Alphaproteobacteria bacterium]|nr:DNA-deoxyinosine glycosylase [Alphaproteobacteria bacterium]
MTQEENKLKYIEKDTKIVILGTFPSEASRDTFFYHKSTNQFWTILSKLYNCNDICHLQKNETSKDKEEQLIENRKAFLKKHQIGLWDVIDKCDIDKSKDSSIKNPTYNDLASLKTECPKLEHIYFSSKKAFQFYQKYLRDNLKDYASKIWLENVVIKEALPSPSSANARLTLEQKQKRWGELLGLFN